MMTEPCSSALALVDALWTMIQQTEQAVGACHRHKLHIPSVLNNIAYHKHQLVRELVGIAAKGGWSAQDDDLFALCWKMSAGPGNTKDKLEDCFNELRDQERSNKNRRINHWRAWYWKHTKSQPHLPSSIDEIGCLQKTFAVS